MSKKQKKQKRKFKHEILLRIALRSDFIEVLRHEGKKKVWGIIEGFPYWMINSKGVIENRNYILDENTDLGKFNEYILREQILITIYDLKCLKKPKKKKKK